MPKTTKANLALVKDIDTNNEPRVRKSKLTVHPAILKDIIFRQAGTREKAVLEGVMNSVDAGSDRVEITVDSERLVIQDWGRGFQSEEELNEHFDKFGTPHEEGDATYGRFRMGRGQLFAFGVNTWRTRTFEMHVDAKHKFGDVTTLCDLPDLPGCRVEVVWYDTPYPTDLDHLIREIKRYIKYVNVPVTVNGEVVSIDPDTQKWDVIDKDFYIKVKDSGSLQVYNLGVFVKEFPGYKFGTGGIVVSRRVLDLNYARNDVVETDPTYKRFAKELRKLAGVKADRTKSKPLTDEEREYYLNCLRVGDGITREQMQQLKLFTDCTGRHWSHREIVRYLSKHGSDRLAVSWGDDHKADAIMQHHLGFVFHGATLSRAGVDDLHALVRLLEAQGLSFGDAVVDTVWNITKNLAGDYQIVPKSDWTPTEEAFIKLLQCGKVYALSELIRTVTGQSYEYGKLEGEREYRIGLSDLAEAWTDGETYIAFDRGWLKRCGMGKHGVDLEGWVRIAGVIVHEYLHGDDTTQSHDHTPEFYRNFHDYHERYTARIAHHLFSNWGETLKAMNRKVNRQMMRNVDRAAKADMQERLMRDGMDLDKRINEFRAELAEHKRRTQR